MSQRCEGCGRIPDRPPRVSADISELIEQLHYGSYEERKHSEILSVVETLDKDIEEFQSEISSLTSKRDRLQSIRSMYIGLTSPIRRLPNELLTHIFDYCCETNYLSAYPRPKTPALDLSKVCSRWRSLALASPRLWSTIRMSLSADSAPSQKQMQAVLLLFRLYLRRSQEHSLDLDINMINWKPPVDDNQYEEHPIMENAVANSHRWKRLTIDRHSGSPYESKAFESLRSLPLLESVTVRQSLLSNWVAHMGPLSHAPKLTELTLSGFLLDRGSLRSSWWQQLTLLSLPAYTPSLFTILKLCDSLVNLQLDLKSNGEFAFPATPGSPIQLPRLRSMTLAWVDCGSFRSILSSLLVPSLDELSIRASGAVSDDTSSWLTIEIHSFLTQSNCSVSKFTLTNSLVTGIGLIKFFRHLPSLRSLVIDERYLSHGPSAICDLLLRRLDASDVETKKRLLPNLSHLTFAVQRIRGHTFDDTLLVKAISSRWVPENAHADATDIACLREVGLYFVMRDFDWGHYKRLRELEDAGLKLRIDHTEMAAGLLKLVV